jgi:hypothetical protein
VTAVVGEIYAVFLFGFGEDVTMFGGVVEGSDGEAKLSVCASILKLGARRRCSGGGRGGGCARKPVGIPSPPRGGRWKPCSRARLGTEGG